MKYADNQSSNSQCFQTLKAHSNSVRPHPSFGFGTTDMGESAPFFKMEITKKTRFDIFKRDNFCCQYCGRISPQIVLELEIFSVLKIIGAIEIACSKNLKGEQGRWIELFKYTCGILRNWSNHDGLD